VRVLFESLNMTKKQPRVAALVRILFESLNRTKKQPSAAGACARTVSKFE